LHMHLSAICLVRIAPTRGGAYHDANSQWRAWRGAQLDFVSCVSSGMYIGSPRGVVTSCRFSFLST
jgi:hypothetical protein